MNLFNTLTSILNAKFSGNIYRKTAFTGSHSVRGTLNDQYLTKYHATLGTTLHFTVITFLKKRRFLISTIKFGLIRRRRSTSLIVGVLWLSASQSDHESRRAGGGCRLVAVRSWGSELIQLLSGATYVFAFVCSHSSRELRCASTWKMFSSKY